MQTSKARTALLALSLAACSGGGAGGSPGGASLAEIEAAYCSGPIPSQRTLCGLVAGETTVAEAERLLGLSPTKSQDEVETTLSYSYGEPSCLETHSGMVLVFEQIADSGPRVWTYYDTTAMGEAPDCWGESFDELDEVCGGVGLINCDEWAGQSEAR